MAAALPFIAVAAQAIGAIGTLSQLFGGGGRDGPEAPALPSAPEKQDGTSAAKVAEDKTRQRIAANQGRQGSFLTSPLGAEEEVATINPSLLGA